MTQIERALSGDLAWGRRSVRGGLRIDKERISRSQPNSIAAFHLVIGGGEATRFWSTGRRAAGTRRP